MGSITADAAPLVDLLNFLRSKTQVDCDSLNLETVIEFGPFKDCTSNQADAFFELSEPRRAALLKESTVLARQILCEFHNLTYEELALEIAVSKSDRPLQPVILPCADAVQMVRVSLTIAPLISHTIFIMVNPKLVYSIDKVFAFANRIDRLCRRLEPSFDPSKLCIKVPATWEGLQACRKLKSVGIRTLATTLFTMEQAILAAEVGCDWISPFVHELRANFDESYREEDPNFALCVAAQQYYERHSYATRVKACSVVSVDEVMLLAGVAALTLPAPLLSGLRSTKEPEAKVAARSLFGQATHTEEQETEKKTFVEDEGRYREEFAKSYGGKGLRKTTEAIELFCEFQNKAEALMRENDPVEPVKA